MEQPQVWHVPVGPQDMAGELQKKISVVGQPECSICCYNYDNVFKAPKLLQCTHTFCLECLSRLMVVSQADGSDGDQMHLSCPFCRQVTTLPEAGPPALANSSDVLDKLPQHQQQVETVFLEGEKLCYKSSGTSAELGVPDSPTPLCICIDIGASKAVDAPIQTRRETSLLGRMSDWKRMLLFFVLMILLIIIVLWPLQCVFRTGSMRCMREHVPSATTITPTSTVLPRSPHLVE